MESLTFFRMGEGEGAKRPSTSFSPPVTFTNVRIDPQNFLTSVAKNSNISRSYLVPVLIIELQPRPPHKKSVFFGQIHMQLGL